MPTIGTLRLTANQYLRPNGYIGYIFQPRPVTTSGQPRLPCYVAKGSRLALTKNLPVQRAFLKDVVLSFTSVPPHIASLLYEAIPDKTVAKVYTQTGGVVVPSGQWMFRESVPGSGTYDQVEISLTEFNRNYTYLIDYQSASRNVHDYIDIAKMRQVLAVGDAESQALYIENQNWRMITEVLGDVAGGHTDALVRGTTNSGGAAGAVSTIVKTPGPTVWDGTVTWNALNTAYNFKYALAYHLQCIATGGGAPNRTATFRLTTTPLCGGNSQVYPLPPVLGSNKVFDFTVAENAGAGEVNYQLDTNYTSFFTDGLRLDFQFGVNGFEGNALPALADLFDWSALGAQLIEIPSVYYNTNQFSTVTDPAESTNIVTGNPDSGTGRATLHVDTDYSGDWNREYYFEVLSIVAGPPRTAVIGWVGWRETPCTSGTINLSEVTPTSLTKIPIEDDIYLNFEFGVHHLLPDPGNLLVAANANSLATAVVLATEVRTKYNSHDANGAALAHSIASLHQIVAAAPATETDLITFCQEVFIDYSAHIIDSTQHPAIDTIWSLASTVTPTTLAACITFLNDLKAKFNRHAIKNQFTVGDTWRVTAKAEWRYYTGKDDRDYTLVATTVTPSDKVIFQWRTDQWEGGWGNVTATVADPYMVFADSLTLALRNWCAPALPIQYVPLDEFTFGTVNDNLMDWTLRTRVTESIPSTDIRFDTFGNMTGVPLTYYVILSNTPDDVFRVRDASLGTILSYSWVHDTNGEPLPYISFGTASPAVNVEVFYEYRGPEPDPSQFYFVTAKNLRADALYDVPLIYYTRDAADAALSPREVTNHAWIMADIAFDTAFFGCYVTQVKSASGDESYTDDDYKRSIDATEGVAGLSDLVVLSRFGVLGYSKLSVEKMSSPFKCKERLLWVGVPLGTPVGDVSTPNTIIYLAKNTLQFFGSSAGKGRIIEIANQWATRDVTLDDGTTIEVTLDGSFIAGYGAAKQAGFDSPIETILKTDCASFKTMATFGEETIPLLGDASVIFLDSVGSGIYRFGESHTVDKSSVDLNEISAMVQKDYVTKRIRTKIDDNLIGLVIPSPAAAIIQIQSFLTAELADIVSASFIAPYGSENIPPTIRAISASSDTYVLQDQNDRRRYHIGYWYNLIYPIKWIMGLYSVDSKFWDNRNLASAQ